MSSRIPARLLDPPAIAVVLVTRQPVGLEATLRGLSRQTLDRRSFEVVVIADSHDRHGHQIVEEASARVPVVLAKQAWSGFAAAKNLGVLMTAAPLILFLRDAEVPAPDLLAEHVDSHGTFPALGHAVMGRIELGGDARHDALSAFAVNERAALAVPPIQVARADQAFDNGPISFKRALLVRVGLFDLRLDDAEDVELAVRLAGHGVQVIPNSRAVTQIESAVPVEQWLDQSKSLGRALHQCRAFHGQQTASRWIGQEGTEDGWQAIAADYSSIVETARKIHRMTAVAADAGIPLASSERDAAMYAFGEASRYVRARGMHEARVVEALTPVDARFAQGRAARVEAHLQLCATPVGQYVDWLNLWYASSEERCERRRVESQISVHPADVYRGYCWVCRRIVDFSVDARFMECVDGEKRPNWREQLTCPRCLLNSRKRAAAQAADEILKLGRQSSVLLAEQTTALYRALRAAYPRLVGFEYFGAAAASVARVNDGLNNEDLTALSFDAGSFDAVLAFDVLEHISDTNQACRESWRVLVEGGQLLFSIPFTFSEHSIRRAIQHHDGSVEHFLQPELHDDPINRSGCLAFHNFGWAVLDEVRSAGFEDVRGVQYWSRELAHFGTQLLFIARKPITQQAIAR